MFPDALFKKISKFLRYLRKLELSYHHEGTDDDLLQDDFDEMDTENEKYASGKLKSIKTMNTDQSISPPPPQSIMTKSTMDRVNYKLTLPSRKFSNTAVSNSEPDELEESALKTPSVGTSLSLKESAFISMSMNRDYDKNAVLTPTMRTIHSKEVESSLGSEMYALPPQIEDSRTMSTFYHSNKVLSRRSKRNLVSLNGGIDEEEKSDFTAKKWKTEKDKKERKDKLELTVPIGRSMRENMDVCHKRRGNLVVGGSENSESDESDDDDDIDVADIDLSSSSWADDDVISEAR